VADDNTDVGSIHADRLEMDADRLTTDWVAQVKRLLDEVSSLEEPTDRLLERYPRMGTRDLAKLMGDAFTAAQLAGRADIAGLR
jgi:phage gp29-like protein